MKKLSLFAVFMLCLAPMVVAPMVVAQEAEEEISLTTKEIGRLSIFEDRALSKADAAFNREDYAAAKTAYEAFLKEHADSPVAAYVLFRKGRCAELAGSRDDAMVDYAAVAEKYPKAARYAVVALTQLGKCYSATGKRDEAVKAWTKIKDNAAYAKCPEAATALAKLGGGTTTKPSTGGTTPKPATTPSTSGSTTPAATPDAPVDNISVLTTGEPGSEAYKAAFKAATREHVRTTPDEAKLQALFKKVVKDAPADPAASPVYWTWVMEAILANGDFGWSERELRKTYYENWLKILGDKFPDDDEFQIALASLHYGAERDRDNYASRLDAQFKKKPADTARILRWVRAYKGNWTKTKEYAAMLKYETAGMEGINELINILVNEQQETYLAKSTFKKVCEGMDFTKLTNDDILKMITMSIETMEDSTTAKKLAENLKLDDLTEEEKLAMARKFLKVDAGLAEAVYAKLKDVNAGKMELFNHYLEAAEATKAIALADELAKVEKYAATMALKKADLLQANKQYTEAIEAFQAAGNSAENMWKVFECYTAMEETEKGIEQLRAIAKAHKSEGPKAHLRIVAIRRAAYEDPEAEGLEHRTRLILALREVIAKHEGTKEADNAQKELDELGIAPANPDDPVFGF